jgi:hypothetical protein
MRGVLSMFVLLGAFFFLLVKIIIFILKYIDYLLIGLIPFFVSDTAYDVNLFEYDMHTVFKILIFLAPCLIWFILNNKVCIGDFYPFKWIGTIICGFCIFYLAGDYGLDTIWSITIAIISGILIGVARHADIGDFN